MDLLKQKGVQVSTLSVPASLRAQDAATAGGMAFLVGELEKRDAKLREPLTSVTYPRDIVIRTGGGWVESTSAYNVSYADSAGSDGGIVNGQSNAIPVMQADIGKDIYKVFSWAHILKVPFLDQAKLQNIGRSLDDILDKGIRLNHDKTMDSNVYFGFPKYGTYGLVNSPQITRSSAVNGAGGTATWATKTPDEILNDVNLLMTSTWAASGYDLTGMANHILIPPTQYARIVQTKVSLAGNMSILEFLLENNIGKNQGIELFIAPCRWCIGTTNGGPNGDSSLAGPGQGGTDRMVGYANDEDRVHLDHTVPLQRAMTAPDVGQLAYLTAYASQFSQIKYLYNQPVAYIDGI